jgi:hypothetical protein
VVVTEEEARQVQVIANSADGYCCVCANKLRLELIKAFPEHEATFNAVFASEHGEPSEDDE